MALGDSVIGLASSGIHSNGYALVRHICFDKLGLTADTFIPEFNCTLGEELLRPTRIYVKSVLGVLNKYKRSHVVKAMSHITGGGLPGNLPRVLPDGLAVKIKRDAWTVPPIFKYLQKNGPVDLDEMFNVFNMGIGYVIVASPKYTRSIMTHLRALGEQPCFLGKIKKAANGSQLEWA